MNFSLERKDNIVIFNLKTTKLTVEISPQMKAELLIICQPDIDALVLDLSKVEYIDSSGLGVLLLAHRQLKENEIPVILVGVQEPVLSMLRISHIVDLFEFYDNFEEVFSE